MTRPELPHPARRRVAALSVACLLLVAAGCTGSPQGSRSPTAGPSVSRTSQAAPTGAPSTAPSTRVTATVRPAARSASGEPAVAAFDPATHALLVGPTSPDRQKAATAGRSDRFAKPPAGSGMKRYLDRRITWKACGKFQCAKVLVPLDWDAPDGPAITLALKKKPATSSAKGTLFINPGGPGGSGQDMVDDFDASSFPNHDVIGWDPRGTGQSTPVSCGTTAQMDAMFNLDASPDDASEWKALDDGARTFARNCRAASGALLDHISTIDTARDLDYLRHLVGDRKLDYMGISYGTFLGATYAEMYPTRVGRMVLDSAVNITPHDTVSQSIGFDRAFGTFAAWCASNSSTCGLGTTAQQVRARTRSFLDRLDSHPIKVGSRTLTQSLAATGIALFLYSGKQGYPYLGATLAAAMHRNDGQYLLTASDYLNGRGQDGKWETIASAFPAIACLDGADEGLAQSRKLWKADIAKAPTLGKALGATPTCEVWTAAPAPQLHLTAHGAAPIVVLGATGDPATPYEQARWMAEQLSSGVLLTWRGAGHSVWELGNKCVKDAVKKYINQGGVPADGTTC